MDLLPTTMQKENGKLGPGQEGRAHPQQADQGHIENPQNKSEITRK